jgi:hypothetical protein
MAIVKLKPDVNIPTQPNLPAIEPTNYRSIVNDDRQTPSSSLIAYIEGMPWTCQYYQQVISKHNDLREIDPGQLKIYQQYTKIHHLEIRVDGELSPSYDSTTGISTVTGSGLLYPFIIPNVSDYFTADAGDAQTGLYRVTNVERKTFNRQSAFNIDYDLVGYIDVVSDLFNSLEEKTIREYYFNKDRLIEGAQPLLKSEEHQEVISLLDAYRDIIRHYFATFFNRRYMTLVLPGQDAAIYDAFLVDYVLKIVDTFDAPEIRLIRHLSKEHDPYLSQPQFWSMMYERDYSNIIYCNKRMGVVSKTNFNGSAFLHGMAFTNIDYLVYPISVDDSATIASNTKAKPIALEDIIGTANYTGTMGDMFRNRYTDNHGTYVIADNMLVDDRYVLSDNFYQNTQTQSLIEILTKDYLKKQHLDPKKLIAVVEKYRSWNRLEQFYYGPILITLIKTATHETY